MCMWACSMISELFVRRTAVRSLLRKIARIGRRNANLQLDWLPNRPHHGARSNLTLRNYRRCDDYASYVVCVALASMRSVIFDVSVLLHKFPLGSARCYLRSPTRMAKAMDSLAAGLPLTEVSPYRRQRCIRGSTPISEGSMV